MSSANLSLHHLVRMPETRDAANAKPPLLILLHGVGSNEQDLFSLTPYLDERFLIISTRAPYAMGPGQFGWYHVVIYPDRIVRNAEESERSRNQLVQFVGEAVEAYGADRGHVYLMGFSQGAIMSLAVMLTEPHLLAGVVAMSGMLPHDALTKAATPEQLHGFPVVAVHGVYDDVLPISEGRALREALAGLHVELDYREYPMGHQISDQSLDDVCGWLIERLNRSIVSTGSQPAGN